MKDSELCPTARNQYSDSSSEGDSSNEHGTNDSVNKDLDSL